MAELNSSSTARLSRADWEVRAVDIGVAARLVTRLHYAKGAANTATYLHGLFRKGDFFEEQCLGVAWWIPPTKDAAHATYPENWQGVLCLSRLAIDPQVPKNGCSFLVSRSRRLIDRARWPCLLTYADTWRGHEGKIYLADNWDEVGMTKPERTYVNKAGRMVARKAGGKTRTHAEMLALGALCVGSFAKHKFVRIGR